MSGVTAAVRELELPDRDAADEAARLVNPARGRRAPCQSAGVVIDDLLQQLASTRRFTLGVPRAVTVSRDGGRVLFLRTSGGEDPVTCLWGLDLADGAGRRERLLADPAAPWNSGPGNVPEAERVRRERAGETADGIVAYSADADCRTVVFALDGRLWVLRVGDDPRAPAGVPEPVPAAGAATDPRIDPAGQRVCLRRGRRAARDRAGLRDRPPAGRPGARRRFLRPRGACCGRVHAQVPRLLVGARRPAASGRTGRQLSRPALVDRRPH